MGWGWDGMGWDGMGCCDMSDVVKTLFVNTDFRFTALQNKFWVSSQSS